MKLPDAAHLGQPWRIHALTPDFRLEDVWSLPTPGAAEDFPRLVELIAATDESQGGSAIARALFAIRWKLGEWFGWDDDAPTTTLRDRLPSDLDPGPELRSLPFTPLYMADDEWAGEIANRTMHGGIRLGWVPAPRQAPRCLAWRLAGRAATVARWPCWWSPTAASPRRTWPRSGRSGPGSCTRRCCASAAADGG